MKFARNIGMGGGIERIGAFVMDGDARVAAGRVESIPVGWGSVP